MKQTLAVLFCLIMAACSSPGFTRATQAEVQTQEQPMVIPKDVLGIDQDLIVPPNTKIILSSAEAQQPDPAKTPAYVEVNKDKILGNTGEAAKQYATDSFLVVIVGVILFIVGAAIWLAKRQAVKTVAAISGQGTLITRIAAQTPKGFGIALMAIGLALIGWTQFVDILSPFIALGFVLLVIPFIIVWYFKMVKNKDTSSPIKPLYPQRNDI